VKAVKPGSNASNSAAIGIPELYPVGAEVAAWLGVTPDTAKRLAREGRLGAILVGHRWMTTKSAILKFLEPAL
jgi:excisionase family DNA binding protein